MKPRVFLTRKLTPEVVERLNEHTDLEMNSDDRVLSKKELIRAVKGKDGLLCLLTDTIDSDIMDANPDLKVIVIDPRATVTARAADLHLALKPGTDVALFNAMLHVDVTTFPSSDLIVASGAAAERGGAARSRSIARRSASSHASPTQTCTGCTGA